MEQKVREAIYRAVASEPFAQALKMELKELDDGFSAVEMTYEPDLMNNIYNRAHGGAIFALIDEAFQAAVNGHGTVAVALNMNLTFHAAPKMGERLTAATKELHAGRRTATYFIEVTDPRGTLIASCQALAYRKDTPLEFPVV